MIMRTVHQCIYIHAPVLSVFALFFCSVMLSVIEVFQNKMPIRLFLYFLHVGIVVPPSVRLAACRRWSVAAAVHAVAWIIVALGLAQWGSPTFV